LLIVQDGLYKSTLPYLFALGFPILVLVIRHCLLKWQNEHKYLIMKLTLVMSYYIIIAYYLAFNISDRTFYLHTGVIILLQVQFNLIFKNRYIKIVN